MNSISILIRFCIKRMKWLPVPPYDVLYFIETISLSISHQKIESESLASCMRYFWASCILHRHRTGISACVNLKTRSIHSNGFPSPQIISLFNGIFRGKRKTFVIPVIPISHFRHSWTVFFSLFFCSTGHSYASFVWLSTHLAIAFLCWLTVSYGGGLQRVCAFLLGLPDSHWNLSDKL